MTKLKSCLSNSVITKKCEHRLSYVIDGNISPPAQSCTDYEFPKRAVYEKQYVYAKLF